MGYDPSSRYRRKAAQTRKNTITVLVLLALVCGAGYWYGKRVVRNHYKTLEGEVQQYRTQKSQFETIVTNLKAQLHETETRYAQLEARYQEDVPQGEVKALTDLVKKRLSEGTSEKRLATLIETASPPKNCSQPVSRRFIVRTPVSTGPESTTSFGNGTVIVKGKGEPSINEEGKEEAWFDPRKPVTILFTTIGGKTVEKTGLLPLHHSVVYADKEYRFTLVKGKRSFVDVNSDFCDYP